MLIHKKIFKKIKYETSYIDDEDFIILHIHTTGLSKYKDSLSVIGLLEYQNHEGTLYQYTIQRVDEEKDALLWLKEKLLNTNFCITYFGERFDYPFIEQKFLEHFITFDFRAIKKFSIRQYIKNYKSLLGLKELTQLAVEDFLSINHKLYVPGPYERKSDYHKPSLEDTLKENEELLIGIMEIINTFTYDQVHEGHYKFSSIKCFDNSYGIYFEVEKAFPRSLSYKYKDLYLSLCKKRIAIFITPQKMILKHFLPDYKNYYYLPKENKVIHKTLGAFIEASNRKKATEKNCYIEKNSLFIPAFKTYNDFHLFKDDFKSCQLYLDFYKPEMYSSDFWEDYLDSFFSYISSHKKNRT